MFFRRVLDRKRSLQKHTLQSKRRSGFVFISSEGNEWTLICLSLIHRFKFQLQLMPHRWQTLNFKHSLLSTMFRSKLWLCLFHALQLSCLIGISSPLAKFKYKKKGVIKKVIVVFEIIIRVTSIYKGFFKALKIMSLCCSLYQSNAFKIWQMANLINIHPRPVVRSSNGSLCSEIPGKQND